MKRLLVAVSAAFLLFLVALGAAQSGAATPARVHHCHRTACATTTTTVPVTTTAPPETTTTTTAPNSGVCTSPISSTTNPEGTINIDPNAGEYWWVNNDAWNASAGPQTLNVCSASNWDAVSTQTGTAVETYPDTEYDVGGRNGHTTETIAQFNSITSTFSEAYPSGGSWDAAYDLWCNNWQDEVMIWNQWSGSQGYWPGIATISLTLDGVPYTFYKNGSELMFFRSTQTASGSVDILAAYDWLVSHGYLVSTDVPTQLEYGVEIASTGGVPETFPMTGLTFSVS